MKLNAIQVAKAVPKEKSYKLYDGKGMYLQVNPKGSKYWRLKYRMLKKEKTLALGVYPTVSLKEARDKTFEARRLIDQGVDPSKDKQEKKLERMMANQNTFEVLGRDWLERDKGLIAEKTYKKHKWILEQKLFPTIGKMPVSEITPPNILRLLRKIEDSGALETANRTKMVASKVFCDAVAMGLLNADPTRDLTRVLKPAKTTHHAAITDPKEFAKLLKAIDQYDGQPFSKALLQISPLLFQRPGEMRQMEWSELDLKNGIWEVSIKVGNKVKESHYVPLPRQAIEIISSMKPLTGTGKYVFSGTEKALKPASDATVNKALRKMGYTNDIMTAHGFRASARTMLDEVLGIKPHIVEQQISHVVRDPLGRAYNRTKHLKQRRVMMQQWADYLDELKHGKKSN